jgi:hypothetical protein
VILHQMIFVVGWLLLAFAGVACIVRGAEIFAEHHSVASVRLGVSSAAIQCSSWRFLPFERNGPRFCTRGAVRRSCSRLESAQSKQLDRNVS